MKNLFYVLGLALLVAGAGACGDDEPDEPEKKDPVVQTSDLCDGKETNTFMPLAVGNKWVWTYNRFIGDTRKWSVTGKTEFEGKEYFAVQVVEGTGSPQQHYFRVDENDNIFSRHGADDYMLFPKDLKVGDKYDYYERNAPVEKRKQTFEVTGTIDTFRTDSCLYKDLLVVKRYYGEHYYKKGFGIVKFPDDPGFGDLKQAEFVD